MHRFISRHICRSLCAFLSRSLINCYTSPSIYPRTDFSRFDTALRSKGRSQKVNAQVLQCAAVDELLPTKYVTVNRMFRSVTIF